MYPRMKEEAEAVIRIQGSVETPFEEDALGPRLSKIRYSLVYEGGIAGEATLEEQKVEFTERSSVMTGMQYLNVKIGPLKGSFVTHYEGTFRDGMISHKHIVVPGSATGQLKGLRGKMKVYVAAAEVLPVTFRYFFL